MKNNSLTPKTKMPSVAGHQSYAQLLQECRVAREEIKKAHAEKALLLSSITSLLIGLGPKDETTYWNVIAEGTFGIPSTNVIGKPFSECGVHWQYEPIANGLVECRQKKSPVRVNDIRFLRPNMEEGYLGLTLIPVQSGELDILIFGADITERKKLEHMKDEFISTVSHELRTPLTVIREGVSQVLEEILGPVTENQKKFLSIALQAIDRLGRIINDLLDISKIEADKLELKMDLIDLRTLINDLVAPSSPYQMRAKDKDLILKAKVPSARVESYVAKDKIIQVFTNLVGNALKFTEKGSIEISIEDKGDHILGMISDTGPGISKDNLSKVFGKFQQFGRTEGPGEKGTGLGLAISKGLIEMHKGKIWVESEVNKGTQFKFTLPMVLEKDIMKQYISTGIRKVGATKGSFTCVRFEISNLATLGKDHTPDQIAELVEELQTSVKKSLRNKADFTVRGKNSVYVILPSTNREDGAHVAKRIQGDYEKLKPHPLTIDFVLVSFPEDGQTDEALLSLLLGGVKS